MKSRNLPVEIQLGIVLQTSPFECRMLRLVCKAWYETSTDRLFHTIVVRPNLKSFRRALRIGSQSHLRHRVRNLAFCTELTHYDIKCIAEEFYVLPTSGRGEVLGHCGTVAETYTNITVLVKNLIEKSQYHHGDGGHQLPVEDKTSALTDVVERFPNLYSAEALGPVIDWSVVPALVYQESMQKAIETVVMTKTRSNFGHLLAAISRSQIYSITSEAAYENLVRQDNGWSGQIDPSFARQLLHLKLYSLQPAHVLSARNLQTPFKFLKNAEGLQTLELDYHQYNPTSGIKLMLANAIFKIRRADLRSVMLRGFTTMQEDLEDFITAHAASLRSLTLADLDLHLDIYFNGPPGSFITLFSHIRTVCALRSCTLFGNFNNSLNEHWQAFDRETHLRRDSIRHRIQEFVCGRGDNPLEQDTGNSVLCSDDSWTLIPPDKKGRAWMF